MDGITYFMGTPKWCLYNFTAVPLALEETIPSSYLVVVPNHSNNCLSALLVSHVCAMTKTPNVMHLENELLTAGITHQCEMLHEHPLDWITGTFLVHVSPDESNKSSQLRNINVIYYHLVLNLYAVGATNTSRPMLLFPYPFVRNLTLAWLGNGYEICLSRTGQELSGLSVDIDT